MTTEAYKRAKVTMSAKSSPRFKKMSTAPLTDFLQQDRDDWSTVTTPHQYDMFYEKLESLSVQRQTHTQAHIHGKGARTIRKKPSLIMKTSNAREVIVTGGKLNKLS